MADFKFVRSLSGMTPQMELTEAGTAMEPGDLVVWAADESAVDKAALNAARGTLAGICMGKQNPDGAAIADGDAIVILPLEDGMILETTMDGAAAHIGDALHLFIDTNVQRLDEAGSGDEVIARVYKIISDEADDVIQVRILADGAYAIA